MPTRTISLPQSLDVAATLVQQDRYWLRYAYVRAPDTRAASEPGQDYLQVVHDGQRLVFALCDGVSQSFFGDVAAHMLGGALTEWLWNPAGAEDWLESRLCELTGRATQRINTIALPSGLSPLVTSVLEHKRALGSESMYVVGSLDFVGNWLTLSWMGDSRLRLWDDRGRELTQRLGNAQLDGSERWSTSRGAVGRPHFACTALSNVRRLAAYSDGLAGLDATPVELESLDKLDITASRGAEETGDDACILIVDLLSHGL